eukprot:c26915_g1_i1 orf=621-1904(-)
MEVESSISNCLTTCRDCAFPPYFAGVCCSTTSVFCGRWGANGLLSAVKLRSSFYTSRRAVADATFGLQKRPSQGINWSVAGLKGVHNIPGFSGIWSNTSHGRTNPVDHSFEPGTVVHCSEQATYAIGHLRLRDRLTSTSFSHACQALGEDGLGQSIPEDSDNENVQDTGSSESNESTSEHESQKDSAQPVLETDWRSFRARLVAEEQTTNDNLVSDNSESSAPRVTGVTRKSWAHPLPVLESGCVLVATEKLDGLPSFERTVILLLRMGSNHPSGGPFGLILNRPLSQSIDDLKLTSKTLTNAFGNCQLHFGGPLEACMFLLLKGGEANSFEEVVPGIYYGAADALQQAAELVSGNTLYSEDFRFFVGYAGWGLEQLANEIAMGLWCVAACSTDLITSLSEHLWEEILQLMGGQYAEMSRKPKREGF